MSISSPLVFLRHGTTPWNEEGRYQGIEDIPLAPAGFEDARQNIKLIERQISSGTLNYQELSIVTSPLIRTRETAKTIADAFELAPPLLNPSLREVSIGRWQGLTSQEVKDRFYAERKHRKSDRWTFKPQGGESMQERSKIVEAALPTLKPHTVVVTHSVIMRILWHILGKIPAQDAAQLHIPHVGLLLWDGVKLKNMTKQQ